MALTNNDILKKIRIALSLKDFEIIEILKLSEFEMSKAELSALFRKEDHPNYKECGDQVLRKFLNGLIVKKGDLEGRPHLRSSTRNPLRINLRFDMNIPLWKRDFDIILTKFFIDTKTNIRKNFSSSAIVHGPIRLEKS
ncbi:DUF1456 family protein [Bacteriovorax sp. DB6_IX]|uniref:DUF1456 family protein n=1 Tax=Bacteriovorax sp. DB6_IX TaxID=1353530 RepID=UPI0009DC1534